MAVKIIVFSHLRWDFVYQRPQHIMSRLAKDHTVYFIEEPVEASGDSHFKRSEPVPNLHVCTPCTTRASGGFHDDQIPQLRTLVEKLIEAEGLTDYVLWFYSPMALPIARDLSPSAIVYDCMDELSAFMNAPAQLVDREQELLKLADVVFTGGKSLHRAKSQQHHAVYCFPSSVEVEHFARAMDPGTEHPAQRHLASPRLGYYGVIDERLDLSLIRQMALAHPEWQLVMVGPVVKIDPASLPNEANIHFFGQRSYQELPRFLAGWDVCLLPFALNEATRFISPTKTLEYMAANKAIVSTPITDVVESYSSAVRIAGTTASFIEACEDALRETPNRRARRAVVMQDAVASTSWNATVRGMQELIAQVMRTVTPHCAQAELLPGVALHGQASATPTLIVGAGPTGLSAAYHLGAQSVLVEQAPTVGGWCRSVYEGGFTFDHAGHIMFSKDPYVHELYEKLLGKNVHWQDREAWIYTQGVYTRYPFQGALFGLPPHILKECLVGAIEARFGSIKEGAGVNSVAISASANGASAAPQDFEQFIYKVWGAGVAKHFAIPYNRKLWTVPLNEMETSWLGGRVPLPDLEEMIDGALRPVAKPVGPNARFGYPLRGGFQALMDGFLPLLKGRLRLNARIARIDILQHRAELTDGSAYQYEQLISTMPLPQLIAMIGAAAPPEVRQAARALRHVSVRCVNLGVARPNITDKHWIYYAGDTVFHRIFVQGNASPHCNPPNGFGLTCEITYAPSKPLPCDGEELTNLCIADCVRVGLLRADDVILVRNQIDMPCAYVIYDHARKQNVKLIQDWLAGFDVILAGRYSQWEYYNSDHAFVAGKQAADRALQAQTTDNVYKPSVLA